MERVWMKLQIILVNAIPDGLDGNATRTWMNVPLNPVNTEEFVNKRKNPEIIRAIVRRNTKVTIVKN